MTTRAKSKIPEVVTLETIKGLSTAQYDRCKGTAEQRIRERAGDKPRRRDFVRELEPLWGILDIAALLVLLSAWLVSSAHILTHVGQASFNAYQAVQPGQFAGWLWNSEWYGYAHQIGYIILAESAMILFMTMFAAMHHREGEGQVAFYARKMIPLGLALGSALFVVVANWQSGVGELESILPPAVTIGLGFWLEGKLATQLERQKAITARYLEAVERYELAQMEVESHPDYLPYLRQEVAQKLMSITPQKNYPDVPIPVLKAAVARELYRDEWAFQEQATFTAGGLTEPVNPSPPVAGTGPLPVSPLPTEADLESIGEPVTMTPASGNGQNPG